MELIIPQNSIDSFIFHSARPSPHASPPMTPRRFGQSYFSAPTSPSRVAEFYGMYDEEVSDQGMNEDMIEFDFQFCGDLQIGGTLLSSAEDLFDGGKIRPLKSPRKLDTVSIDFMACGLDQSSSDQRRGRAVDSSLSQHYSGRKATRSLSPLRTAAIFEKQDDQQPNEISKLSSTTTPSSVFRKWKLKDFLLFRSASEGRASYKYPMKNSETSKKDQEDRKSRSYRLMDSFGSVTRTRKKSQMSAHEEHYIKNKAASESLKKKTYLPYKQGIFAGLF